MVQVHQATAVVVLYNGVDKTIRYEPNEQVEALLNKAEDAFGITTNRHLMSLYNEAGQELSDSSSVEAAGVRPGDQLVLRQSVVKGG